MPLTKTAKCGLVIGALTAVLVSGSPVAFAEGRAPGGGAKPDSQGGQPAGEKEGQEIGAKITYNLSRNGSGGNVGAIQPVGDWTPPPCWFAPKYTPGQYKAYMKESWSVGGDQAEWVKEEKKQFSKGQPDADFHMKDKGDGYWWGHFINRDRMDETAAWECMFRDPWWVKKGDDPKVEHAISPEILAGLAYEKIRVPDTSVTMKPQGAQKVNLNTWLWLDKATFKPVSVTASLPALDMTATTTAEPVGLHIEPGTEEAKVFPASGDCPINADGSIGEPYAKGKADQEPPCGMAYLRSTSGTDPYQFKASVTWKVSWNGTGGAKGDLPDGTFETTQDVNVQEIQSINR
ncbi:hypothetical protein ABZ366_02990 [Streptomyces sp. NPDC005904]|uniref:hypothetical protein n=1 Tax=Streptomyces sp. NPDC005904 TaxID=3154570 RepID=UPI0033DE0E5F